jgi:hypothetical protein
MNIASAILGRNQRFPFSVILIIGWLVVIGLAEWFYAVAETEPPEWDVLSYAAKAFYFWDAINHGKFLGLLDLPPTIRPPGTVMMSYPLGFSVSFGAFYFRSVFIPLCLVVCAIYIAGYLRELTPMAKWLLATLAITIGGMPILFQFQGNDEIPNAVTWGLVDNFLAGMAAVAIASARRSVSSLSPWWAIVGILAAAFCLLIKPAGALVMVLVAASSMLLILFRAHWSPARLWQEIELRRLCVVWLIGTTVIYGLVIVAALTSQYLGATNLAYGAAALAVLQQDFAMSIEINTLLLLLHISFGYPIVLLVGLGLVAGIAFRGERGAAAAALLCLMAGIWFWVVATEISQVRYFLPFGVMTFIIVVPSLLRMMQYLPAWLKVGSVAALSAPTVAITLLLLIPQPPVKWQQYLGINLSSRIYRAENEQALALLNKLQNERARSASIFFAELWSPSRSFGAVFSYWTFVNSALPRISGHRPVSWEGATTFRLSDIAAADYIVFGPIDDATQVRSILESRMVADLGAEYLLMKAWFSSLTPNDGVEIVSETRVRLLRIADRDRFQHSIEKLRQSHDWRSEFRAANPSP